MATYTIPGRLGVEGEYQKAIAVLLSFLEHRVAWGKTVTNPAVVSGQFRLTVTPDLTQQQIDHLMQADA